MGREVEQISLADGSTTELLDLTSSASPQQLVYIDFHHAFVQLDKTYAWDPATTTLGPVIASAPDAFTYDGAGNFLGLTGRYDADGGLSGWDVVSVRTSDGAATKLGADPFSLKSGSVAGVQLWSGP
jgi:hypothetical protein